MVGAFDRNPARQLAALQRQVAELERRLGGAAGAPTTAGVGPGVSTAFGALSVRTVQPGFPAELTSAWNATTGYAWKQLALEGVSLTNPDVQLNGTNAVSVDGDTGLTAGTQGWMEPDPQAGGWLFLPAASGGSSGITVAEADGTPSYAGTTTLQFDQADGFSLSQPSAGVVQVDFTGGGGSVGDLIGPESAQTGQLALFTDPSGRFVGNTAGLYYRDVRFGGTRSAQVFLVNPAGGAPNPAGAVAPGPCVFFGALRYAVPTTFFTPAGVPSLPQALGFNDILVYSSGGGSDSFNLRGWYDASGNMVYAESIYTMNGNTSIGRYVTWYDTTAGSVVTLSSGMQNWMRHYALDGTAGLTAGSGFEDGIFVARGAAITTLGGGASLSDVITKVNEIIARLQSVGLTN